MMVGSVIRPKEDQIHMRKLYVVNSQPHKHTQMEWKMRRKIKYRENKHIGIGAKF